MNGMDGFYLHTVSDMNLYSCNKDTPAAGEGVRYFVYLLKGSLQYVTNAKW